MAVGGGTGDRGPGQLQMRTIQSPDDTNNDTNNPRHTHTHTDTHTHTHKTPTKPHADRGFGVGHTRDTQTKGVWVWGEARESPDDSGRNRTVVFVDTEGFESTARSSSYDDRIFAVAAVLSSLLVYNLPETIRESDVAKLSFAVDLATGFYDQWSRGGGGGGGGDGGGGDGGSSGGGSGGVGGSGGGSGLNPGRMLWVIQRDFLQGKGVQQLVDEALSPVPNPAGDKELDNLNRVRSSLAAIAGNSTGEDGTPLLLLEGGERGRGRGRGRGGEWEDTAAAATRKTPDTAARSRQH